MKIFIFLIITFQFLQSQNKSFILDDFENISAWQIIKSEGVEIKISQSEGYRGKGIRIDYNFKYGTGYCGIQKALNMDLPDNYRFSFFIKANSLNNNFEIKFLDGTRDNVWWMNNRNFEFPNEWKKFIVRKRNIHFAWGPTEDKSFNKFDFIEFTIASFTGGSGTIIIDDLSFEEVVDTGKDTIKIFPEHYSALIDNNPLTKISKNKEIQFVVDFGKIKEIGGIRTQWGNNLRRNLKIFQSDDTLNWNELISVDNISKKTSIFKFKDLETRYLKFFISSDKKIQISDLKFYDHQFAEDKNNIFFELSDLSYKDFLPRYFNKKASYWTITGVEADEKEALINSDGMIEVDKNSFSLMPFIKIGRKVLKHTDFQIEQKLENDFLPFPSVVWNSKNIKLEIKTFANGIPNKTTKLFIEYRLINKSRKKLSGNFLIAVLPFQVNPYYQTLNNPGGVSYINSIRANKNIIDINEKKLLFNQPAEKSIVFDFQRNDVISAIKENNYRGAKTANDLTGLNSGLLLFDFDFRKTDTIVYRFIYDYYSTISSIEDKSKFDTFYDYEKRIAINYWQNALNKIEITSSNEFKKLYNIVRANLAYILINKDYSGIQPGSRSYERSWIRDGSLTSTALLRFGFNYQVRDFINWYGKYIFENGKVPCVVDNRGPDPVDEHDSHGEFLYLLDTYFKFSRDTSILIEQYDNVKKIVNYIDSMTSLRKTEKYKTDTLVMFYGLMPESISHEGYSAKPMHSYWDDFFTICGLNSAVNISRLLTKSNDYNHFVAIRDDFQKNLINSIHKTIAHHRIDYIPGCVELGDFDPTSTSIALFPCNQKDYLPEKELRNTFNKYYEFVKNRAEKDSFVNFTPYEVRTVTTFLLLNEKNKAYELLDYLLKYQFPKNWLHWAEVVWHDTSSPQFIGDMPHTWVGSDFINAFRTMLVYEDDFSMIFCSGFNENWLDSNNRFEALNLYTQFGTVNIKIHKIGEKVFEIFLSGTFTQKPNNLVLRNLLSDKPKKVYLNDKEIYSYDEREILFNDFPAKLRIEY